MLSLVALLFVESRVPHPNIDLGLLQAARVLGRAVYDCDPCAELDQADRQA